MTITKTFSLTLIALLAVLLAACGSTETLPEPVAVPEPTVKTIEPTVEEEILVQEVPEIKQAQVIGVIRELRKGGCVVKQYANTSGIHYKQLVVTCGDPEKAPAIPQ